MSEINEIQFFSFYLLDRLYLILASLILFYFFIFDLRKKENNDDATKK